MTDPREQTKVTETTPLTQPNDINKAFDDITLSCFDVYQKPKEEPQPQNQTKYKPYLSKKKQEKLKKK